MQSTCPRLALALWAACWFVSSTALAGFTKITEGDIVNDGGWCYGCAWADVNGDGFPDLFVDNNDTIQGRDNFFYLNNGDGSFTKVIAGPVVTDGGSSYGCTWGDYDNDGCADLFVANYNENNFLYHNNGAGTFTSVTQGRIVSDGGRSTGCAWGDYDNDGRLDLYVCNRDEANFLYHNEGDSFARVLTGAIATDVTNSSGCAWSDYDGDGFLDLFVANVGAPNCLYRNNGNSTFTKVTGDPVTSDTSSCNGASWGDLDNDGDLDLFVATGVLGMYADLLYRNDGDGTFTKITDSPVVDDATWSGGGAWADFDNDGDLDLFVGGYDGHNRLYENDGSGVFTSIDTGALVTDGNYTMGAGWADLDRDGDLDLFTAKNNYFGGNNALYRNDGNANHWLSVRCVGTASNRMAVGARVRVKAGTGGPPGWQMRELSTQTGGCNSGQSDISVHFGLGGASAVESLTVRWPSGQEYLLTDVAADQFLTIVEPGSGVEERATRDASRFTRATVVRGVLFLPPSSFSLYTSLFAMTGRAVMTLHPGANDVSNLSPGVYIVRSAAGVAKVVLAR